MKSTTLRIWHSNISAFIAPMVIFFALSGSLQIFDLHEAHGTYTPSAFLSAIGSLHKDQVLASEHPGGPQSGPSGQGMPDEAGAGSGPPHHQRSMALKTMLLKWVFYLEALGLATTTLIGVWIGVTHPKRARTMWILMAAGTVIPVALILI